MDRDVNHSVQATGLLILHHIKESGKSSKLFGANKRAVVKVKSVGAA